MYKPPFLRRILPWMYVLVFIVAAPILLFYTAGYQYNLKKHLVERNGALIIDGSPKDAIVFLDGVDTGKTIPYTFQHVTPGWHTIRVEKSGYSTWEKHLEIRAEEVTFANDIRLWSTQAPKIVSTESPTRLQSDPNDSVIATVESQRSGIWNPRTQTIQWSTFPTSTQPLPASIPVRWNSEGTAFVLNGINTREPSYWTTTDPTPNTDQLPNGIYSWSEPYTLTGSDDRSMIRLQARSNRFVREELPSPYLFRDQDLTLAQTTSVPAKLLLTKSSLQDRVYQLANPALRLVDRFKDLLILEDAPAHEWFALTLAQTHPYSGDVHGDYPRWFDDPSNANRHRALLINGGELWLWEPGQGATLLWRQAENLRQAAWDTFGAHVLIADAHRVFSLELDDRDGRIVTPLADLQEVRDITVLRKTLYISGVREDKSSIFTLSLE
jgi:hypothetical protein